MTYLDTRNGTGIDEATLLGIIHDEQAFLAWQASGADPFAGVIGPLFRGDPLGAQVALDELTRRGSPSLFRVKAFQADIYRELGDSDRAVAIYEDLSTEHADTPRAAVIWQHLGKVHFVAGDLVAARECFRAALQAREADPATPDDQVQSSRMALARVEQLSAD